MNNVVTELIFVEELAQEGEEKFWWVVNLLDTSTMKIESGKMAEYCMKMQDDGYEGKLLVRPSGLGIWTFFK